MKRRQLFLIALPVLVAFTAVAWWRPWLPHDPRVDDRQQRFQAFRGHLRTLRDSADPSTPEGVRLFETLADELLVLTDEQWRDIPARFPPDTRGGRSAAAETVWSDRAGFIRAADRHRSAVAALAGIPDSATPDVKQAAVQKVAASCQACHEDYRD